MCPEIPAPRITTSATEGSLHSGNFCVAYPWGYIQGLSVLFVPRQSDEIGPSHGCGRHPSSPAVASGGCTNDADMVHSPNRHAHGRVITHRLSCCSRSSRGSRRSRHHDRGPAVRRTLSGLTGRPADAEPEPRRVAPGQLGPVLTPVALLELGNAASMLLILRATDLLQTGGRAATRRCQSENRHRAVRGAQRCGEPGRDRRWAPGRPVHRQGGVHGRRRRLRDRVHGVRGRRVGVAGAAGGVRGVRGGDRVRGDRGDRGVHGDREGTVGPVAQQRVRRPGLDAGVR